MIHCDPGRPAHWSTTARTKHWQSGYLKPALIRKTSVVNFSCSDGLSARGNPYTDTLYTHQPILIPIHVYIYNMYVYTRTHNYIYIYSHNMCMWLHICVDRLRFVKPWGSFWLVQLWGWLQHRKQPNGTKRSILWIPSLQLGCTGPVFLWFPLCLFLDTIRPSQTH